MKKVPLVFTIITWIAAIVLLVLIWSLNAPPEVRVDLSDIKSRQIIAGTNIMEIDLECSYDAFVQQSQSFDLVMVGFYRKNSSSTLICLGRENGKWYRAEKQIQGLGWLPLVREVKISDQQVIISYGKDKLSAGLSTLIIVVFLGVFGWLSFSYARDDH